MKLYNKQFCLKLMLLVCALFCTNAISAENKITIEPFTVGSYDIVNVPVLLDNSDAVAGFQFDVTLPAELEWAGTPSKNTVRLLNGHQLAFNQSNGRVMLISRSRENIAGQSGAVVYLPLKLKAGMLANETVKLGVSGIQMTSADGMSKWLQDAFEVNVDIQALNYSVAASENLMVLNPGSSAQIAVNMTNSGSIMSFQLDVVLPEGLTMDKTVVLSNRCSNGAYMDVFPQKDGKTTRLMLTDLSGANAVANGNEGTVFTFTVNAAENFPAEGGVISFEGFQVSYASGKYVNGEVSSVTVINGATAYDKAKGEIAALETSLTEALATIAETAADVKDNFTGAEIAAQIDELKKAVDAAYADKSLSTDYETVMAPVAEISKAIADLVAAAQSAQAELVENNRMAANKKAYDDVVAQIAGLKAKLDAAVKAAAETCPNADVTTEVAAATAAVTKAGEDAEAAFKAVESEGVFAYTVDAESIEALINAVTEAAQKGQAEYNEAQRVAANKAAYEAVTTQIAELKAKLDAAVKAAAETCPNADVTAEVAAATAAVTKAGEDAEAAFKAVETEGEFAYTVDAESIDALIAAVTEAAQKGQAEYDEAQRVAANKAAYDAVIAELDALQAQLDATAKDVAEKYPNADVTAQQAAAAQAIADARAAAEAAFKAVETEGAFAYTVDKAGIEAKIAAVAEAAHKGQTEYDEAQRVAANKAAYDAVIAELDALQAQFDAMAKDVAEKYPNADVADQMAAAAQAIADARAAAEAALKAVESEGVFEYTVDKAGIEAKIAAVTEAAQKGQAAYDAEQQRLAANKAAYDAAIAAIDALQANLETTMKLVDVAFEHADVSAEQNAAQAAIDAARAAAEAAYKAVEKEGTFEYTVDTKSIQELIDAIVPAAKASEAAYEEAQRKAANEDAYNAVLAQINELQTLLYETLATVNIEYPGAKVAAETKAAQDAINKVREAAEAAYKAVAEKGEYNFTFNDAEIKDLIAAIVEAAKSSGIDEIFADELGEDYKVFTVDGMQLAAPQAGKVNILVGKNGTVKKVLVK